MSESDKTNALLTSLAEAYADKPGVHLFAIVLVAAALSADAALSVSPCPLAHLNRCTDLLPPLPASKAPDAMDLDDADAAATSSPMTPLACCSHLAKAHKDVLCVELPDCESHWRGQSRRVSHI